MRRMSQEAYTCYMISLVIGGLSYLLVPLFLMGMTGSAVVVAVTLARDLTDFLSDSGSETSTPDGLN